MTNWERLFWIGFMITNIIFLLKLLQSVLPLGIPLVCLLSTLFLISLYGFLIVGLVGSMIAENQFFNHRQ